MARFRFSLQNLLDIKEKIEEQEKNNYSQANLRLQEAVERLEFLKKRRSDAQGRLREEMSEALDVMAIRDQENAIEILKMYVENQQQVVFQREQELEEARLRLHEAMKERKTFEKLREKAFEEFMIEENRREQKEIDELVSYRFGSGALQKK